MATIRGCDGKHRGICISAPDGSCERRGMPRTRQAKKPRFVIRQQRPRRLLESWGPTPIEILDAIHQDIVEGGRSGRQLRDAASDVLDGWVTKEDLRPFFRQKLMTMVRHDDYEDQRAAGITVKDENVCGQRWTVDLTDRAIRIFWPDRIAERAA